MKWFDLLILLILGLSSLSGYKRGFILTLFSLGSYIIAFITAKTYYPLLAQWIRKSPHIFEGVQGFVGKNIKLHLPEIMESNVEGFSKLPNLLENYLYREISLETYANQTIEAVKGHVVDVLATFFINIISMIILFIAVRTLILLIGHVVNQIFELPVLHTVNSLGGGVAGFIRGFIFVVVAIMIMTSIAMMNLEGVMAKGMQESTLLPILSQHVFSYLLKWL